MMGFETAPTRSIAAARATPSNQFGSCQETTSPGPMPRRWSAAAMRAARACRSPKVYCRPPSRPSIRKTRSGVRSTRASSIAQSDGCGHSPAASWRGRRLSGGRVGRIAASLTHHASEGRQPPRRRPIETAGREATVEQARQFAPGRKMFVDGEWVGASNDATYSVPNPATEEPVGSAPDATADDMRRAIAAARRAFDAGPWPRSSRHDRARVLTAVADGMERRKEELRQMLIAEAGATYLTHDI